MLCRPRVALALALCAALNAPQALANDSAAELDAGGLVLVKDPEVALVREDLTIGLDRITVRYVFRNRSAAARTLKVAFPLPPIDGAELTSSAQSLPDESSPNFVGFTVTVDGQALTPQLEERAFLGAREVSDLLRKHAVPLNPMRRDAYGAAVAKLTPTAKAELAAAGLIPEDEGPDGGQWRSEAKFYWDQTFPAGRDLVIEHAYRPVKGSILIGRSDLDDRAFRQRYCLDDAGVAGVRRFLAGKGKDDAVRGVVVPYIVTTARNWAGTIGTFALTIDKGHPKTLVSLCRNGLVKTGPSTFSFTATNFVPDADLRVLYVSQDAEALGIR
ncbi:DUF4424 domain-containing protein [Methylobacterium sp. Leaf108]|uniref:DUF4424 domain-containing protein n=1 Tax=Methylobacterium sp. Leaf108 TaxID=1736256 RepID=UPI0006F2F912|nr:DUF4424 domain-containing protein [Methylobacterium sp. Leaf108]KQP51964.1 hypothetical protein ASF39_09470 [Methylobacterium sp. Leaf108]